MRMKGDPPMRAQPKPGYNVQLGTENQFVVGFSVHQRPGDSGCLVPHLMQVKQQLGRLPQNVIADGGYGNEEDYAYLEAEHVGNYVKYTTFHQELKKRQSNKEQFRASNLPYDEARDAYQCPCDRWLVYVETKPYRTQNGYLTERRHYECEDCSGCELKAACSKAVGNRRMQVSFQLQEMRARARSNLLSDHGKALRSRRGVEVESVFGQIKHNWQFRRFMLRGLEKVETEWGLLCIAHNMSKLAH